MRIADINRNTNETIINLALNLDGTGKAKIETSIPFFDHMLDQLVFHSSVDLELNAQGDIGIDFHHTVEDCGICLGKAFFEAMGDKRELADTDSFCFQWTMLWSGSLWTFRADHFSVGR